MSPGILGKKIGMTQVFRPDGQVVPVTVLKAGPCMVVQRKTPTTDGYDAVQLGLVEFVKPQRINKPTAGHFKKAGVEGVEVPARVPAAAGRRRSEARRPGAGGPVQAQGQGGRDRHQQGPRLCRRGQAAPLPRRRRHRTARCSTARRVRSAHPAFRRACSRHAHGRPHGQRAGDGAQPRSRSTWTPRTMCWW